MLNNPALNQLPIWKALQAHQTDINAVHMRDLFDQAPERFERFHLDLDGLLLDYSKHRITEKTLSLLRTLCEEVKLDKARDALFAGKPVNHTEGRAALHMALRGSCDSSLTVEGENVSHFVETLQAQIKSISDQLRDDPDITDVIHIGVGGSDLGPRLVCQALSAFHNGPRIHFLSNIDGQSASALLAQLNPEHCAVLIASKTFTTLETMQNADFVKDWLYQSLPKNTASQRLFAMTSADQKATDYGVQAHHILPMRDWIGGRFSVWSSIGLPIAIAFGFDVFKAFLDGAETVDQHFIDAPFDQNMPIIMALLGVWYRNFWDFRSHSILPYADSLGLLADYMQQLDMESNGKAAPYPTSPVIFGGAGTGVQHAFMQSLHQGGDIIPCDFIIAATNPHSPSGFQEALNANALAQAQALMHGRDNSDDANRHFEGNRPSSCLVLPQLDGYYMGMLLALYEHKIFVQGHLWGINSFDQFGVELGKTLAKTITPSLTGASSDHEGFDSSTAGLIRAITPKK